MRSRGALTSLRAPGQCAPRSLCSSRGWSETAGAGRPRAWSPDCPASGADGATPCHPLSSSVGAFQVRVLSPQTAGSLRAGVLPSPSLGNSVPALSPLTLTSTASLLSSMPCWTSQR